MIHTCKGQQEFFSCGCELERCDICKAAKSIKKCGLHQPKEHNSQYYYLDDLHGYSQGIPRHTKICAEFEMALKEMKFYIPVHKPTEARVLDIGAGIGANAPMFMQRGYRYEALEIDSWACKYIKGAYSPHTHNVKFEDFTDVYNWDAIVASHVLEHFADARAMLKKMFDMLKPGGHVYIIIPDDTDLGNPDHLWFFKESSIRQWFEEVGFEDIKTIQKQIVVFEDFIYIVARKPV